MGVKQSGRRERNASRSGLLSGGFEVDPRNEELKRLPAVLLKKLVV